MHVIIFKVIIINVIIKCMWSYSMRPSSVWSYSMWTSSMWSSTACDHILTLTSRFQGDSDSQQNAHSVHQCALLSTWYGSGCCPAAKKSQLRNTYIQQKYYDLSKCFLIIIKVFCFAWFSTWHKVFLIGGMWGVYFDKALAKRLRNWRQYESLQMTKIFNSSGWGFWHKTKPDFGLNAMRSTRAPLLTAVATRRLLQLDLRPGSCQGSGSVPCPPEPSPPHPKWEPFNPPPHSPADTFPPS